MTRKILSAGFVVGTVFLFSGCFNQEKSTPQAPLQNQAQKQMAPQKETDPATQLEKTAPQNTNDLPTAIEETDKDLKLIDNDLKEINNLNMDEGSSALE